MRLPILLLAVTAAWGQPVQKVAAVNPADHPLVSFATTTNLEKQLDDAISLATPNDPMLLLGPARALYLLGYGAVITQEVSLVNSPIISPFRQQITPQEVIQVHQRKIDHLPVLRKTMHDMWATVAATLNMVPNNEQIVIAVRLLYKSWEDTKGLPGQILLKGSRGGGLAGVQIEEQ